MYSIKLDSEKFWTGSYAKIGKVEGGIDIPTLTPDMEKAKFYKYDYYDVTTITHRPKTHLVPVCDENGEPMFNEDDEPILSEEYVTDENGEIVYEEVPVTTHQLGWFFVEEKYNEYLRSRLEEVKQIKIDELSNICERTIIAGLDIETSTGVEHYSLEITDQLEIMNQYNNVLKGATEVPYHADNKPCRMYSAEEMTKIATQAIHHITYNRTYFNYLKETVKRCSTEDEVNAIEWGTPLPADLDELFVAIAGVSTIKE